jgi:phage recombination protein Bet
MSSETKHPAIMPVDEGQQGGASVRPLMIRADVWTPDRIDLVRRTVCPPGVTDDEMALFVEQCKRSGLDPLLKECFCVPRRQNAGSRERPNWVTRHEFQPSEAGMLARAERFPDFRGISASAVFAEDEILIDAGAQGVTHRFNPTRRKGPIVGAWARVVRDGMTPIVVWLDFEGYAQTTPLWAKIPTTMIEKCARVAVLRKAYPEAFGGLYIREEMPPEEQPTGGLSVPPGPVCACGVALTVREAEARGCCSACSVRKEAEATRRQADAPDAAPGKLGDPLAPAAVAAAAATRAAAPAAAQPASSAATEAQASRTAAVRAKAQAKAQEPTARFGGQGFVGKPLRTLSVVQLKALVKMGEENLHREPKAEWAPRVEANLVEINAALYEAEQQAKANLKPDPDPGDKQSGREPGEDDGDVPF